MQADLAHHDALLRTTLAAAEDAERGLRLTGALGCHWTMGNGLELAFGWLDAFLRMSEGSRHREARAKALYFMDHVVWGIGKLGDFSHSEAAANRIWGPQARQESGRGGRGSGLSASRDYRRHGRCGEWPASAVESEGSSSTDSESRDVRRNPYGGR
jgi:hypothetical protein